MADLTYEVVLRNVGVMKDKVFAVCPFVLASQIDSSFLMHAQGEPTRATEGGGFTLGLHGRYVFLGNRLPKGVGMSLDARRRQRCPSRTMRLQMHFCRGLDKMTAPSLQSAALA